MWSAAPPPRDRVWLHLALLLLTIGTTTLVGAEQYASFVTNFGQRPVRIDALHLVLGGLWYSGTALLVLGFHEMGHYLACRYYGIRASLPYFIPMPPVIPVPGVGLVAIGLFGTLGAVIRIRQPIRRKHVIFDVGIAGPLAGMLIAIPALVFGLAWSRVTRLPPNLNGVNLGEPLVFQLVARLFFGPIADGYSLNLHPMGFAAWFGLFMTALNLIPAGQLDGGHVAYGCFGRRAQWLTAGSCLLALLLGVTLSPSWLFWLAFVSVLLSMFGWRHPPVEDEAAPLGTTRWMIALLALAIFVFCFVPVPISELLPRS